MPNEHRACRTNQHSCVHFPDHVLAEVARNLGAESLAAFERVDDRRRQVYGDSPKLFVRKHTVTPPVLDHPSADGASVLLPRF